MKELNNKAKEDIPFINKAMKGDETAFATLLNKYKLQIYNLIQRMVSNESLAEDLAIEVFSKAFSNIKSYSSEYAFSTWLYKIATNHTIDYIRCNKNTLNLNHYDNDELNRLLANIPSDSSTPEEIIIDDQHSSFIQNKIDQLKPLYRTLIDLRYFKEYSYEEIAKELNTPIGTIKAQLHRAKKQLYNVIK